MSTYVYIYTHIYNDDLVGHVAHVIVQNDDVAQGFLFYFDNQFYYFSSLVITDHYQLNRYLRGKF